MEVQAIGRLPEEMNFDLNYTYRVYFYFTSLSRSEYYSKGNVLPYF